MSTTRRSRLRASLTRRNGVPHESPQSKTSYCRRGAARAVVQVVVLDRLERRRAWAAAARTASDYYGAFVRSIRAATAPRPCTSPRRAAPAAIDHLWLRTRDVAAQRRFWETVGAAASGSALRHDSPRLDPVRRRGRDVLVRRGRADRERAPRVPRARTSDRRGLPREPRSARGSPTTARRVSGRTTTRATSAPSCSTRTATTSKRSAITAEMGTMPVDGDARRRAQAARRPRDGAPARARVRRDRARLVRRPRGAGRRAAVPRERHARTQRAARAAARRRPPLRAVRRRQPDQRAEPRADRRTRARAARARRRPAGLLRQPQLASVPQRTRCGR